MKFDKTKFLKTELGGSAVECVVAWNMALNDNDRKLSRLFNAQWEVYQIAVRQFYHIDIHFTRTSEYFGICDDNENFIYKELYN